MEMDIAQGAIGPEGKYTIKFTGGKLVAEALYDSAMFDAGVVLKLDSDSVVEALKAAIPGKIDDMIFDILKASLKTA